MKTLQLIYNGEADGKMPFVVSKSDKTLENPCIKPGTKFIITEYKCWGEYYGYEYVLGRTREQRCAFGNSECWDFEAVDTYKARKAGGNA
jgi:hypothetical protein